MNHSQLAAALMFFAASSSAVAQMGDVYVCPNPSAPGGKEYKNRGDIAGCKKVELPAIPPQSDTMRIKRGRDGHFEVYGKVNGVPVHFLVDTGASSVAVSDQVADEGNLPAGRPVTVQTANGTRQVRKIDDVKVSIGLMAPVETTVTSGLVGDEPGAALLGQSFLKHYDIQISGHEMVLTRRPNLVPGSSSGNRGAR